MTPSSPGETPGSTGHDVLRGAGSAASPNGVAAPQEGANTTLRLSITRPEPGVVIVRMSGEIDLSATPRLRELIQQRLTAAYLHAVILDLASVSFCDSSGLELMLEAQLRAERRGITLLVVPGRGAVRRLLELTGLTSRFTCLDSITDALPYSD